ncbi:hypothetical protein SB749_19195, partial [Brevibacterium sp. SIMBA_078]|uniref:hypothetical protein n=1 Tax=Brevibacterium sp. SIMBA_078 TaxID=3085816 RepID=UPI00397899F2
MKKGIMQTKINSDNERKKLLEVYEAIQNGEISTDITDMSKFSKTHALGLYKKLQEKRKTVIIKEIIDNMPDNYYLINEYESFREFL